MDAEGDWWRGEGEGRGIAAALKAGVKGRAANHREERGRLALVLANQSAERMRLEGCSKMAAL